MANAACRVIAWVALGWAAGVAGCGIFDTREPESPSQLSSSFIPPSDPPIVFQNMINAFRDLNTVNYLRSFSDSSMGTAPFHFEPSSQSKAKYAAVFAGWNRQSEQQYFEAMKAQLMPGTTMVLEFFSLTQQGISADSAQYETTYRLSVPHAVPGVPVQANGRAQFVLAPDRSRSWTVIRWIDLAQNPTDFTWSDLKGTFGQ